MKVRRYKGRAANGSPKRKKTTLSTVDDHPDLKAGQQFLFCFHDAVFNGDYFVHKIRNNKYPGQDAYEVGQDLFEILLKCASGDWSDPERRIEGLEYRLMVRSRRPACHFFRNASGDWLILSEVEGLIV